MCCYPTIEKTSGCSPRLKPILHSQSGHIIEITHIAGDHDETLRLCGPCIETIRVPNRFALPFSLRAKVSRYKRDGSKLTTVTRGSTKVSVRSHSRLPGEPVSAPNRISSIEMTEMNHLRVPGFESAPPRVDADGHGSIRSGCSYQAGASLNPTAATDEPASDAFPLRFPRGF